MKRSIIAGDIHIQKKPGMWSGRYEISGDDVYALDQIVRLAVEHEADLYLLGDVLDSVTNLPRSIVAVQDALGTLAVQNRLFYLQGQHELSVGCYYESRPWLSLVKGSSHIGGGSSFQFCGMDAAGLDYFPQAFEALAFSKIPADVEVLFLHGTIDVAFPTAFHFTGDSLKKFTKLKYVFASDYHQPLDLLVGKTHMYYTGSAWQVAANEPREKSVLLVQSCKKGVEVSRIPLLTRKIVKLSECYDDDGSFKADLLSQEGLSGLPKELQTPVILVDLPTNGATMEELAKFGHLYSTSGSNPDIPTQAVIDQVEKMSNSDILEQYVDRQKNPEKFAFTLDVIENPVEDSVKRLKEKMGVKTQDHVVQASVEPEINLDGDGVEEEEVLA